MIKDASAMAQAVKAGRVDSYDLVSQAIEKIKKENGPLNAVTELFEEEALRQSKEPLDLTRPFAGVPILIKDAGQTLKGKHSTLGSKLFAHRRAEQTVHFTQSLLDAGFIIIGQTNIPEFALKFVSDSPLFGPVHNPVHPDYHAGGSSGGAAAAVQKDWVPLAAASDGGGSIRIPASFSGLIGLKVSRGRTITGPGTYRNWGGAAVDFAMTQTVRDTRSLLQALAVHNYDPMPFQALSRLDCPSPQLKDLTIGYSYRSPSQSPVSDEAVQAVEETVRFLKNQGFRLKEAQPSFDGQQILRGYYQMNAAEMAKSFIHIEKHLNRPIEKGEVEYSTRLLAQYGRRIPAYAYSAVFDDWDRLSRLFYDFHQAYHLFIQPTTAFPAPSLEDELFQTDLIPSTDDEGEWSTADLESLVLSCFESGSIHSPFAYIYNLTGQPAISLPLHTTAEGLPLGVMLSARKNQEELLLDLAEYLEENKRFHYYK